MRSISLFTLIAFALTNSANGDVIITAEDVGGGKLRVGYQTTGEVLPAAFALDIRLSNGATFDNVTPLSECFTFYPGRFRDYINPANPNWEDPHYLPVAPVGDPEAMGGLGTSGITIEMAAMLNPYLTGDSDADFDGDGVIDLLDSSIFTEQWLMDGGLADLNGDGFVDFSDYTFLLNGSFSPIPPMAGDILWLQLNGNGAETTIASISLNLVRGGIVLEDATAAATILPTQVTVIVPEPATVLFLVLAACFARKAHRR
jgi:hypothetical protein